MTTLNTFSRSAAFVLLILAGTLLPATVEAQLQLSVDPNPVSVQTTQGTNAPSRTVQVMKSGAGALKWNVVQSSQPWLTVSPTRGTNTSTLTLTFATSGLGAGQHQTTFRVDSNANSVTVTVTVNVLLASPSTLTVTCPQPISVTSPDGSAVVVNYTVTTTGGTAPVTVTGVPASGSSFPVGTTTVQVNAKSADGQTASCSFPVTVSPPTGDWVFCANENQFCSFTGTKEVRYGANGSYFVRTLTGGTWCNNSVFGDPIFGVAKQCHTRGTTAPTLTVTCPANMSVTSPNGSAVVVNYTVTTSGGLAPVTVTGTPASGSSFPVGTTPVQVNASSSDGQTASCGFSVTVTYTPPTTARGPQSTITCPAGAVNIFPGTSIQGVVNTFAGNTTFCIKAGTHTLSHSITPKTGNTFIGEFGAILDGTGWSSSDTTEAAFRAYLQDIDFVTIRNLVIRKFPQRAIMAYFNNADHWTIENNEIALNGSGIVFPSYSVVRSNYIHDNAGGGYIGAVAHNAIIENNEIARNGREQKIGESANVTFRNNFVHHNLGDGIWLDNNNINTLIENNLVEDNGGFGIFYEISADIVIRNNTIRRSGDTAIFISTSKGAQIYNNTLENNFRGITYFVNCNSVGGGTIPGGFDLTNNSAHDNTVIVGTQVDAFATVFSYTLCTATQLAPYQNLQKNLTFSHNAYDVPFPTTGRYWFWNGLKYWNEWQALGHDTTGSVQ